MAEGFRSRNLGAVEIFKHLTLQTSFPRPAYGIPLKSSGMASDITGALLGEQGFGTNTTSLPLDTAFNFDLDPGAADGESSEDEAFIATQQAASNRKTSNLHGRAVKKGGGFQSMGLNANLLKAITRKGFSVPTPIQRKTM